MQLPILTQGWLAEMNQLRSTPDVQSLCCPSSERKIKNVSSLVPAIRTVIHWERQLIASPHEATHDADRC